MGLLDGLLDNEGARLGLGLLAAGGPTTDPNKAGFGARLQDAIGSVDQWKQQQAQMRQRAQQEQMQALQMQQMQSQMAQEKAFRDLAAKYATPAQPGLAPIQGDALLPPQFQSGILPSAGREAKPAGFDREGFGAALEGIDPIKGLAYQTSIQKDNSPLTVKEGESLLDRKTLKPIFTAPKTQTLPSALQEYQYAVTQGEKRNFTDWTIAQKRAGAANMSVSVAGPENQYNKDIGAGLAKDGLALVDAAKSAPEVVANARMIKAALDSGAITGTGADTRLAVQKAAETMGIVEPGKAATTQQLMAGLGKLTLSGIKTSGLGGGNGFTDKDREFLNAAISGQISDTPANLRRVADLSERVATATHQKGAAVIDRWKKDPALKNVIQDTALDPIPAAAAPGKTIVKTGMYGGKRVVQYSDGTTAYAD